MLRLQRVISPALVLVVSFVIGGTLGTSLTRADLNYSSYVWISQSMSSQHEPINVLFTINGTSANTETHIGHHGWNTFVCGGNLYFYDHQTWESTEHHMATGGYCDANRDHIRTNQHRDDGGAGFGTFNMGAAHYEDSPGGCYWPAHRVLSFNAARDDIWMTFGQNGHSTDSYYHGNTDIFNQCDGTSRHGDGWVRRLVIP